MAIVKADAYGHDIEQIVPALEREGIKFFAVATLSEGVEARKLSKKSRILILGGTFEWNRQAIEVLRKYKLDVVANDLSSLKTFARTGDIKIHLKLDTGMNRLGLKAEEWNDAVQILKKSKTHLEGLLTHYATAEDRIFERQVFLFEEALRWFWSEGIRPPHVHSENSAALFGKNSFKKGLLSTVGNWVRPGIAIYGYLPGGMRAPQLHPVLELVSEIGVVKRAETGEGISYGHLYRAKSPHAYGVVPLGYADGLSKIYARGLRPEWRTPSNTKKGSLILCGAICMDMVMVKASGGVLKPKDRIVFWGRFQNPLLQNQIVEPYELNLRIAKRIPRMWAD